MSFLEEFSKVAQKALQEAEVVTAKARQAAGAAADAHRDKIDDYIGKAGTFIDEKTEGKYHQQVIKAQDVAGKGVDIVAQQKSATIPDRPAAQPKDDSADTPQTPRDAAPKAPAEPDREDGSPTA
ncbi:hypothetical protein KEM60_01527 [Austwickia sp. TVS 96-490-7B]|uniref:antitoxin n=1 Tax=Austwickia sp. TVS 96-490-7B TaxID=2830843 RepID=UPI001C578940|nr:antitoxin [Austwickia sp. TVS 96-490-7B]MBW3085330.1 hypothetical protein [Austwickia sp. TVS 96-490-7B]